MVTEWQDFTVVKKLIIKNLYGFWGLCLKIIDICMDFEPCFKIYNFASVHPKGIKLCQITTLNVIFRVVVSIYRLVKIWNSPQFPAQFRNGQLQATGSFHNFLIHFLFMWRFDLQYIYISYSGIEPFSNLEFWF